MLWTYLGLTLIGLVAVQLVLGAVAAFQRVRAEAARRALEMAQMREELAAARARHRRLAEEPLPWNGFRKFVVSRKITETPSVCSFHLKPHDAKPLPVFKPGQYLTFRLAGPHGSGQLIRCYSLSDHTHQGHYRVSIKRVPSAAGAVGAVSGLFHDVIQEGDLLDLRAPTGNFHLEPGEADPVVLIGAGIGVTPVFCMLATLAHQKSRRPVWFFYGVRHRRELLFKAELDAIVRDQPNLNLRLCFSQPEAGDRLGEDYQIKGRITPELLQRELPSSNFRFYYCGPGPMMEMLTGGLKAWGVPESHLHFEAFGPMSLKRAGLALHPPATIPAKPPLVTFRKSGQSLPWDGAHDNLLDLAEQAGIVIASGCRAGNCGTCAVAMQWGEVSYIQPPGSPPEARTCLTCIAQPKGDIVLEA
ncbi:MAG: 2Fe-2S iron-sulfur cluster binding domain-containing protein [Opitutae bacterium]|nr:2Fe-2S iron-sulfur cluster binding domain-containing protein [Opitutae bacterium]